MKFKIEAVFEHVETQSKWVFEVLCNLWCNMNPLLHFRNEQLKKWIFPGEHSLKKAKIVGKIIALIFWVPMIYLHRLPGKEKWSHICTSLLDKIHGELMKKWPHLMGWGGMLFYYNSLSAHTSIISISRIVELCYKLIPYPPYSPDMTPYYFFFLTNMKSGLLKTFITVEREEVIA